MSKHRSSRGSLVPLSFDIKVIGVLLFLSFMDPSLRFGLSVGLNGLLMVVIFLTGSYLISSLCWDHLLSKLFRVKWTPVAKGGYAVLVSLSALLLNHVAFSYCDREWQIGEEIVSAKIEYFCVTRFDRKECVRQVNICKECALNLPKFKREQVVQRLKSYRAEYPAAARAAAEKADAPRVPAASASLTK